MGALKDIIRVQCPQCGGDVPIYNRFSHQAVCEYCRSVVVYGEDAVKVRGKMSVLPVSSLKIPLYGQGTIQGKPFMVLGRIRYKWERGVWDEYFLGFDDGSFKWLTEDDAELYLENVGEFPKGNFDWGKVQPGDAVELIGKSWIVTEKNSAVCVGGEGQLPFELVEGEEIKFFECENDAGEFGTYEIDEDGEKFFYGTRIKYNALNLPEPEIPGEVISAKPVKDGEFPTQISGTVRALACKSCGGSMIVETQDGVPEAVKCPYCGYIEKIGEQKVPCPNCQSEIPLKSGEEAGSVTCPTCKALVNVSGTSEVIETLERLKGAFKNLSRRERALIEAIPLGTKIIINEIKYEIIGRIVYYYRDRIQEEDGYYTEFMLFNPQAGYLWLECSDGHWSYGKKIPFTSEIQRNVGRNAFYFSPLKKRFKKYHGDIYSRIAYVEGELPWVAKISDSSRVLEFASPPYSISIEETSSEVEAYLMTYLPLEELKQGLQRDETNKKKLPRPSSWPVPNQPYPEWKNTLIKASFFFAILSLIFFLYGEASQQVLHKETVPIAKLFSNASPEPYVLNQGKSIDLQNAKVLGVKLRLSGTNQENFWLYFDVEFIDTETREAVGWVGAELSFYTGYDSDGRWTEDNLSYSTNIKTENLSSMFTTVTLSQFDEVYPIRMQGDGGTLQITLSKKPYNPLAYVYFMIPAFILGIGFLFNRISFHKKRLGTYEEGDD